VRPSPLPLPGQAHLFLSASGTSQESALHPRRRTRSVVTSAGYLLRFLPVPGSRLPSSYRAVRRLGKNLPQDQRLLRQTRHYCLRIV